MTTSSPTAPARPDVVVVLLDDLGFADPSCFGSTIDTPTFDRLAGGGLRYTNFHTAPICSPTRACVLTGRNHHAVGMGLVPELPTEDEGYTGRIPPSAAMVARHLGDAGYATFALGKWHLAPSDERTPDGPRDHWPIAQGFDRYYGFLGDRTDQWFPRLVEGTEFVDPPARPEDGYHLTEDLVDRAIGLIDETRTASPETPFFLYLTPGAVHTPHQAPVEWIERYRGRFDHGWDAEREHRHRRQLELGVVPPGTNDGGRPDSVPAWDELPDDERVLYARQMELFAAYVSHTDAQIGRLVDHLERIGRLENTLIVLTADNGPAPEGTRVSGYFDLWTADVPGMLERLDDFGGTDSHSHYALGWTWTGATPFRYWKFHTWLGGVRTPCVVHWPARVPTSEQGSLRRQFVHAIDLTPTILAATGVEPAAIVDGVVQQPFDGASALETLADPSAADPRTTQYFEMMGARSIYHDGWRATTDHLPARDFFRGDRNDADDLADLSGDAWALFDLRADASESRDLAASEPERLARMVALWEEEAVRNRVLPVRDTFARRGPTPPPIERSTEWVPGDPDPIVRASGAGFEITTEVTVESVPAEGVLWALYEGSDTLQLPRPAWECHLRDGLLVLSGGYRTRVRLEVPANLRPGTHRIAVSSRRGAAPGDAVLVNIRIDGSDLLAEPLPPIMATSRFGGAGRLMIGRGVGLRWEGFDPDRRFTGRIERVLVESRP